MLQLSLTYTIFLLFALYMMYNEAGYGWRKSAGTFAILTGRDGARETPPSLSAAEAAIRTSTLSSLLQIRGGGGKNTDRVKHIDNLLQLEEIFGNVEEKTLIVIDFTATWCGPCQRIAPIYSQLAEDFKKVVFLKVTTHYLVSYICSPPNRDFFVC